MGKLYLTMKISNNKIRIIISAVCVFFIIAGFWCSLLKGTSVIFTMLIALGVFILLILGLITGDNKSIPSELPLWIRNREFFILFTAGAYFFAKYTSILLHEWSHSLCACILGIRSKSPLDIHYGNWTLSEVWAVDGGHFYRNLFAKGQDLAASATAIAGPTMNLILIAIAFYALYKVNIGKHPGWYYIFFWVALHNIGQLWSYIPVRTVLYSSGDIILFCKGLHISPWIVFLPGTIALAALIAFLFKDFLPRIFKAFHLSNAAKYIVFLIGWLTLFVHYGSLPILLKVHGIFDPRMILMVMELGIGIAIWVIFRKNIFGDAMEAA